MSLRLAFSAALAAGFLLPIAVKAEEVAWRSDDLSNAARLAIRIHEQLPLSGDYRVAPDGTVSIPVLGRISVAGKLLSELEHDLSGRITEITRQEGYVAIEIAEYKPLFVSGLVAKPGAFAWLPGLNVGQAISLAGGIWRSPASPYARSLDHTTVRQKLINELKWMMASQARLKAEKAGLENVEVSPELTSLVGAKEASRLVASQQALLASRRTSLAEALAALDRAKSNAQAELGGLKEQVERIAAQLAARKQANEGLERLQEKGLIPLERGIEQKIRILELEEKATNVAVALARIQGTVGGLERDALTVRKNRESEVEIESNKLDRDIAAALIELEGLDATATAETATGQKRNKLTYQLSRGQGRTTTVELNEPLRPGDVLLVNLQDNAGLEAVSEAQGGE